MTTRYVAPVRDIEFALEHIADIGGLSKLEPFAHADAETVQGLVAEFGRFAADVIGPIDRAGDVEGSQFDPATGGVKTPTGWRDAYAQYVRAGWGSVPFPQTAGGGGFPWLVGLAIQEMLTSASMAFSLNPMLTQGAIDMLLHHGSAEQQRRYLAQMVSGEWTGTMNLTEPAAGSDLGAITTKARPAENGTWRITGQKIFITYGDHDLASNIVHLVLARVPGAPPGTKGISCFLVPKYVLDSDGAPGDRNAVRCLSIEHKLGIHGSPTCVLAFDDAVGELIGDANAGMQYMFTMMNNARLAIGLQGLAVGEVAYQQALQYAIERVQGRSAIVEHPDVRRMLLTMRSLNEAMRGVLYLNGEAIDIARHGETDEVRAAGQELADLLTPVSKGWCTDMGTEVASLAIQVHGGMGYIEETGIAQRYRDIRIAAIYEGTNGIQAIDLVGRKLTQRGGSAIRSLLQRVDSLDAELAHAGPELASIRRNLATAVAGLSESTEWLLARPSDHRDDVLAGATPYLRQWGIVLGGWVMGRQALAALSGAAADPYFAAKVVTARFYCEQLLPAASSLTASVCAGADTLLALTPTQLTSH
jgi:alkylation response protein AidB-like acyl-CoA dehydrogenase